jgi:hypothetical protein
MTGNEAPTEHSTRPLGNSEPPPTPLARIIGPHAQAHMKNITSDATRAVREMIERKRRGGDGHTRD